MNARQEQLARLGIPEEHADMLDKLSEEEICTRRCETCEAVIERHPDGTWRFKLHVIRCEKCIKVARELGYTHWEARYVV